MSKRGGPPERAGAIAWMARNPVVSNLVLLAMAIGGLVSALHIKQEIFPEFDPDSVQVRVRYPGASPEEIETGILRAVEEAVRGVDRVARVVSVATEGSGTVTAEFERGAERMKVYQEIQQAVDRIRTLPLDAERPEIGTFGFRRNVVDLVLYGDAEDWVLRALAEDVREVLLQQERITEVGLGDSRGYEIQITPRREALRAYGLTLQDIATKVAAGSVELPGGGIKTATGELLVRVDERRDQATQFREIPLLTLADGSVLRVGQVAEVREGFEEVDRVSLFNGLPTQDIEVYRVGDQKPADVSDAVRDAVVEIVPTLPEGVFLEIRRDRTEVFNQRLRLLLKNGAIGLCLVLLLLGIFLELRLALWVTVGIPVSFLGAFLLLPGFDVSLNMISMFAFIIALGIVVDDAIVVGESVYSWRERGLGPQAAAEKGARRMAVPVAFSILTNIVAFLPILFIPGWMGSTWYAIPVVVSLVFLMSWVESIFVLPSHLAALRERPKFRFVRWVDARQQRVSQVLQRGIDFLYRPALRVCLRHRYLVLASAVAVLYVVIAYAQSGRLGMTLMPVVESDDASARVTLPVGSPFEEAREAARVLEESAQRVIEAHGGDTLSAGILTRIDAAAVRTRVFLTDPDIRPISTAEFTDLWREATGPIPGVLATRFESDRGGPGGGASLTVELSHGDIATLETAGAALGARLREFPNVADVDDGFQMGKEQLNFRLTPEGRSLGLTATEVARQVRHAFFGAEAKRQMRGQNEVRVMVRLADDQRISEYDIEQLMLRTPDGGEVPLRQAASVERGRAFTSIERRDGRRTLRVTAQVTPDDMTGQVIEALERQVMPFLQQDFPGLSYTYQGRQAYMRDSMAALGRGYLFALLAVYFLLAIPFRSYTQPFVVMFAIPFGIVGAVIGHVIMGYSLSVISVMGIIALSGVVINGSLVMVVYANERRQEGRTPFEAVLDAGVRRFRPILLTTLTTFGGLAPMIFETSRQARFMIPMAISLGYGLLFATAITLVIVPSLYLIVEDFGSAVRRWLSGSPRDDEAPQPATPAMRNASET